MKKIILCLLTLSLIFTFCACKAETSPTNKNLQNNLSTSYNENSGYQGKPIRNYASSLADYNSLISKTYVPENFVTYQDLAAFGEFEGFVELTPEKAYFYTFDVGMEKSIALYVYYNRTLQEKFASSNVDLNTDTVDTHPTSDLRYDGTNYKPFKQNDFYYVYINGKLLSITWESNGILFVLGSECELAEYEGDNVILNMLLTKGDESAQVKAAFDTMIQNKLNQAKQ